MRTKVVAVAAVVVLVAVGCGDDDSVAEAPPVLLLASTVGTAVVDMGSGELRQVLPGSASTPDGEILVEATSTADGPTRRFTTVRASDATDRSLLWTASVGGSFEARVASADGQAVVLGPPRAGLMLAPGTLAPGRTETALAIAWSDGEVQHLDVPGNIEPEAFSVDGEALFVVSYQPAEAPTFYQVRRLDLATGELGDVFSVDAELQESMRGTARTQAWDPAGDRLYTLYTLDSGTAFVHVLDLEEQWAHCVDLPAGIGATSAGIALSDDGRSLYVADTAGGGIAEVDTQELTVTDDGELPPPTAGSGPVVTSSVAIDGRQLIVGSGSDLDVVDRGTLEPVERLHTDGPVLGLDAGDGVLNIVEPSGVVVRDRRDGSRLRWIPVDLQGGTILSLGGHAVPTYAGVQCAC